MMQRVRCDVSEIKKWTVLILCLICAVILIALAIVILPLSIITKLANRFLEKSRDAIERVAEKHKE